MTEETKKLDCWELEFYVRLFSEMRDELDFSGKIFGLDPVARFYAMIKVEPERECWLWQGVKANNGYAIFQETTRKPVLAHRWIYQYLWGDIERGLEIDHCCAVRNCVSPYHLQEVTHAENCRLGRERRRKAKEAVASSK